MAKPTSPRPVTAGYLQSAAMHYLSGRSASLAMLRQTLERRAKRRLKVRTLEPDIEALIAATVARLHTLGLVNDAKFSEAKVSTLSSRGLPARRIAERLRQKGVGAQDINAAITGHIDDREQARRFAERRRLGPWRRTAPTPELRRKELAALARAGFSYVTARAVIDGRGEDA